MAVVQHAFSVNANGYETDAIETVTLPAPSTPGNLIVGPIMVGAINRTIVSVTDDGSGGSNSYAQGSSATNEDAASSREVWVYLSEAANAMQTLTAQISSALAGVGRLSAIEISGYRVGTPQEGAAVVADTNGTSHVCGPIDVPSQGGVLIGVQFGSNGTYNNAAGGWVQVGTVTNGQVAYLEAAAGSYSWTTTTPGSEQTAMCLICIANAEVAPSGNRRRRVLMAAA